MFVCLLTGFAGAVASAQTETATESVLYSFCAGGAQCPDNSSPDALIQASDGNFYGVTYSGGTYANGSFFQMTSAGTVTELYFFCNSSGISCPDGAFPSVLIEGADGYFYGLTQGGGSNNSGTFFKVSASGTLSTLYNFCAGGGTSCPDGANPADLVLGSDGNFYGTTTSNGLNGTGEGTVFRITPAGALTTLYTFCNGNAGSTCPDGAQPLVLVQGSDGNFYGTTQIGGTGPLSFYGAANGSENGAGTIFKMTPAGALTTLYTFCKGGSAASDCADGFGPNDLIQGKDGNFYGTTQYGGTGAYANIAYGGPGNGGGSAFKMTPSGTLTTLYNFCSVDNCDDGGAPVALIQGSAGNLFGTTSIGGAGSYGAGTAFQLTPGGSVTTLYSFCTNGATLCADAAYPDSLVQGSDGNLYGGSSTGGSNQDGAIFKLSLSPALSAPVQLSLAKNQIDLGEAATLSWQVLNGGSTTMQQCYAFVQGAATDAGSWTGLQSGTLSAGIYSGSKVVTPTAPGTYTYALTCGGIESGSATLTVGAVPPLTISTSSLANATEGVAYAQTLAATGGIPPYTWSLSSGSLPAGLTLSASAGGISGTPAQSGKASFTVEVKDSASTPNTTTANLSITVNPPALAVSTTSLAAGTQGASYSQALSATGGVPPYTWSVESGSLPAGLALTAGSGVISGTPTTTGTSSFAVKVTDAESTPQSATASLTISINAANVIGLSATPSTGVIYNQTVTLTATTSHTVAGGQWWVTQDGLSCSQNGIVCGGFPNGANGGFSVSTSPLSAGVHTFYAYYSATAPANGQLPSSGIGETAIIVGKATPTITWSTPAPITQGTPLSSTQLDATASVAGTFAYSPAAGQVLSAGAQILSVTFTPTDATDYKTATATVTLTVNPAVPALTIAPASLTFAAENTGSTSAAQTITLTNSGTAALSISSIAASGDFAETNTCTASLSASSNCTVSITFTPTAGGTRTGTLTITDNATGSPQTVALSGVGATVTVATSATSLTVSAAGGTASTTIQLGGLGGFSGTVDLACSVTYQGTGTPTDAPTCSLNPAQQQVSGSGSVSSTLTVNTTAPTSSQLEKQPFFPIGGGAVAALMLFVGVPRRRWRGWGMLAVLCIVVAGSCMGCGGGSTSGKTASNPGTTTGSYSVSVTATSGTVTATAKIPLTVQ